MQQIKNDWDNVLSQTINQNYFKNLESFIKNEYVNKTIYPEYKNIFRALKQTCFDDVKVVILGQDPYHEEGQAHGLCFSVDKNAKTPPSLKNIFKEINNDVGINNTLPDLNCWAKQGILLLNTVLTVEHGKANSHKGKGWEIFTDYVITKLAERSQPTVFILWGGNAKSKINLIPNAITYEEFIDYKNKNMKIVNHLILQSSHPSPLSVYRGFIGCKHFSKTNEFLEYINTKKIDWSTYET